MKINKGLTDISSLLKRYEEMMKSAKVIPDTRLFEVEPNWKQLEAGRCPICGSLLKKPRGKSISICYGRRHGDFQKFIIKNETLERISGHF